MRILEQAQQWKEIVRQGRPAGRKLGFVPTMGAIHEGHLSLIECSRREQDLTAVSIFVNPAQFNDPGDLETYPRRLEEDIEKLTQAGVDYLFVPKYEELYPDDYAYRISEESFSLMLCGANRPGHFTGVLTVVMKLLLLTGADAAYFGEKDWQQYQLVRGMAGAFFLDTQIVGCPIVREPSGLALSSRNQLLDERQRAVAPHLYRVLSTCRDLRAAEEELTELGFTVEYLTEYRGRRLAAAYLGEVRLLDNVSTHT